MRFSILTWNMIHDEAGEIDLQIKSYPIDQFLKGSCIMCAYVFEIIQNGQYVMIKAPGCPYHKEEWKEIGKLPPIKCNP